MRNVKFDTMRILWGKLIYSHTMSFEQKSIELYNLYLSHPRILRDFSCHTYTIFITKW